MKKLITIAIMLMLMLTACGNGGAAGNSEANLTDEQKELKRLIEEYNAQDDEQGNWDSTSFSMIVDGDKALIDRYGDAYIADVDTEAKTITVKDGEHDGNYKTTGDAVFNYQMIGGKLVLTTESKHNFLGLDKTYSLNRQVPQELMEKIQELQAEVEKQKAEEEEAGE